MSLYFPTADEMGRHTIFPGVRIRTAAAERMMLSVVDLEPHSVVEEHDHPHEQVGMVLSGRVVFTIGGEEKTLGPGDLFRIPGGVRHKVRVLDEPARALDVFTPVREEYR
jgi:quercetin dioxygenase-like cupin family protein